MRGATVGVPAAGEVVALHHARETAAFDAAQNDEFEFHIEGVFELPVAAPVTDGEIVYFDDAAGDFTTTETGNTKAGIVIKGGATKANIKLTPGVG